MGQKSIRMIWLGACAGSLAAGCGGGQGAGSSGMASHTSTSNGLSFTYSGQPKPLLSTSSGTVSILGQAGATFSNVTLVPPPNLNSTYLIVARTTGNSIQMYKSSYTNLASEQLLFDSNSQYISPGISAYGLINFTKLTGSGTQLFSVHADGTGLGQINFNDATGPGGGRYSTDGTNRLTFVSGTNLYIGPSTGGTASLIQSNAAVGGLSCWNASGTSLAYCVSDATIGNSDIYTTATVGGAITDVTPLGLRNTGALYPMSWSPDGVTILAAYRTSGGVENLVTFSVNDPGSYNSITPSSAADPFGCFSPDGSMIAIERPSANTAPSGVYISDAAGLNQTLAYPDPPNSTASSGIAWSPFLPKETVVAASGSTFYHQASAGFLLSQNGSLFGSFVAFAATTPSSAAIQAPATTSVGSPFIFTITADSITSIGYINSYFSAGTTLTLSSTPTVVVSVDSVTGQVDLVAPAAEKATASRNADGSVSYAGKFKAVYDGTGRNLAPMGTNKIVLNPKTGQMVSASSV